VSRAGHGAWLWAIPAALGTFVPLGNLAAQTVPEARDEVILNGGEGAGHSGRLAVNIAAGTLNQQASSALLAIGDVAVTQAAINQHAASGTEDRATAIVLGPGAFAGISGMASINITAGTHNQSANLAMLAIGQTGALSDQLLAQTRARIEPSGGTGQSTNGPNDAITLDETAFGQGSGLFQANLIGGERNSSANTFSLTVLASGQP
jgi:microcystin-dependent protein